VRSFTTRAFYAKNIEKSTLGSDLPLDTDVIVRVGFGGQVEILGQIGQVVDPTLLGDDDVVEWEVVVGDVVVLVLDPKQAHALESLDAEDEHADTKVGIAGAGATVYV
jgi:hypothetical protein